MKLERSEIALIGLALALTLFLGVRMMGKALPLENDASAYISGATAVLEGGDIYEQQLLSESHKYVYPPLLAIALAPVTVFGPKVAVVAWTLICLASTLVSMILLVRSIEGRTRRWRILLAVGAPLLGLRFLDSNFGNGQANTLLLLVFSITCYAIHRRRQLPAGLAVGFGIALKLVPVGLVAYFLLRRHWRATAGAMGATLALAVALPLATLGPERTKESYQNAHELAASFAKTGGHELESYLKGYVPGLSLRTIAFRLLRPIKASSRSSFTGSVNLASLSGPTAEHVYQSLALAVMLLGAYVWVRRDRLLSNGVLFDVSVATIVLLLASPYVRKAYFVMLLVPFVYLLNQLADRNRRQVLSAAGLAIGSFVALALSIVVFGVSPPVAPLLVIGATVALLFLIPAEWRAGFTLFYVALVSLGSSPGLIGSTWAAQFTAICAMGLSVLVLLLHFAWEGLRDSPTANCENPGHS